YRQGRLIEEDLRARLEPARRPDQRLPAVATILLRTEQQHFSLSSIPTATEKPCRKDAAVIEHEKVTLLEVGGQISDGGMGQRFRGQIEHEHAGGIPQRGRTLRNQFPGQVVIEISGLQADERLPARSLRQPDRRSGW